MLAARSVAGLLVFGAAWCGACGVDAPSAATPEPSATSSTRIPLPAARVDGEMSVEQALALRRSRREFAEGSLSDGELGQLAWAAQGISDEGRGLRTAPSAGALYPLEVYVVDARGAWHYDPEVHAFERVVDGDVRAKLAKAALGQGAVEHAAADVVITGVIARTAAKYGDRAQRYVQLEAGHAAQNVLLQATALSLAAVPIGAFDELQVRVVLRLDADETPLYVIPVGHPR